jgi:hypothetical protein
VTTKAQLPVLVMSFDPFAKRRVEVAALITIVLLQIRSDSVARGDGPKIAVGRASYDVNQESGER